MNAGQQPDVPPGSSGQGTGYRVDIQHGPAIVGEGNTQIIASYNTHYNIYQGTWTDGVAPPPLADDTGATTESPYRGLAAFGEQDAGFFFGRKEAAAQVAGRMSQRLNRPGLLMVSGVSGAGKSSLLRAGVLPCIRRSGLAGAPEAAGWPCLVLTPGREPLTALASVAALAGIDAATTHQALKADPADFALTARQVAESEPVGTRLPGQAVAGCGRRLLLIVDQFEQLFIQCPDEHQRLAFLTALHAAATAGHGADERPAALVVLVVRADYEARCAGYPVVADAVQDRFLVTAMTERQLRMVITDPAKKAGSRVDEDLVTVMLGDIRRGATGMAAMGPPGMTAPAGILPLLSHVLDTAWRARAGSSLTVTDYDHAGGIERAVADSAERAYARLTPAQQAAARTVFVRLTATSPDGTVTADRATRAELLHGKDTAQARDVEAVLEAFAAERLLTLAADTVEVSHEVLLQAWPLLRDQWLAGTQADRIVRTRLRAVASEWDRSGRDPSYLYTGTLLRDGATTMARAGRARQPEPSPVEQEFLSASNRARRRATTVRRRAIAVLLSLTTGLAAVAIVAYNASQNADHASQDAARQRDAAIASQLVTKSEAQADTNPTASKIESLAAWHIDPSPQSRYALISAAVRPSPAGLPGWTGPVPSVAISRDARVLAACTTDGTVRLWDVATQQQIGHPFNASTVECATAMTFSPDGQILATSDDDGIHLWNVATQQQIGRPLTVGTGILGASSMAFSPDGQTLATGEADGIQLWNVATRQQIGRSLRTSTADGVTDRVVAMAFSPDGRTLATGDEDHTARLWNVATQQQIGRPLRASTAGSVIAVAFRPDGRALATGGADDTVRLWNVATQQQIGQYFSFSTASSPGFYTVAFSPDGRTLAIGIQDGMAWLWNVTARRQTGLPLIISTAGGAASVAFSPDGQTVATGSQDGTVRLWNVATQLQVGHTLTAGTGILGASSVAFSPDGQTVATGSQDGTVRLWNVATRQQIGHTLTAGADIFGEVDAVAFSPDGRTLATGNGMGTVRLWNVATQQQIGRALTAGPNNLEAADAVAFSPDGRTLATGSGESSGEDTVRLWNVATQQQIGHLPTVGGAVAFSPDGRTLATGSQDGTVQLWNVATRQQIGHTLTVSADTTAVDAVAFSPDGQTLATGNQDNAVRLWNVATQQQIAQPIPGGNSGVNAVAFRPDGRTLATADAGGMRIWDVSPIVHPFAFVCDQVGSLIPPASGDSTYRPARPTAMSANRSGVTRVISAQSPETRRPSASPGPSDAEAAGPAGLAASPLITM